MTWRAFVLGAAVVPGLIAPAAAAHFEIFDLDLPADWTRLSGAAGEETWGRLDGERHGLIVTLFRSPGSFEHDPTALAGKLVTLPASTLGGQPASSYEWESAGPTTSAPLHLLVRCVARPLADGRFACAAAGVAGVAFESRRQALAGLLDSLRLVGVEQVSVTPTEAPDDGAARTPTDAALAVIEVSELDGLWTGVWTRRPGANIYDGVWRSAKYPEVRDIVRLERVSGSTFVFSRDGNGGRYTGTLGPDGRTISGTASWYSKGMTWTGRLALAGDDESGGRPPPPVRRVKRLVDSFNGLACELTNSARFTLQSAAQITKIEVWYNWRDGETTAPFELRDESGVVTRGRLARGACDAAQGDWCFAAASLAVEAPAGSYAVRVSRDRLCRNAESGDNGFIRLSGMQ